MPTRQNRKLVTPLHRPVANFETDTEYQLLTASPSVLATPKGMPLASLAAHIADADVAAGRAAAYNLENAEIVQIRPAAAAAGPNYFVSYSPGRQNRPQHPSQCPLCIEQLRDCGQNFAEIRLGGRQLSVLANPFGYMPVCTTWASSQHLPQAAGLAEGSDSWQPVFEIMLNLCSQLSGHIVGFNSLAGNSLDHFHLVSHRPISGLGPYAVQQSAALLSPSERRSIAQIGARQGYPIELWRIGIPDPSAAAAAAASMVQRWLTIGGATATANCTAICEDGYPSLYVFPRCRLLRAQGWRSPAFMELSGVFIASEPREMVRIRSGQFDHAYFSRVLASLRPPLLGGCEGFKSPMRGAGRMTHALQVSNQFDSICT